MNIEDHFPTEARHLIAVRSQDILNTLGEAVLRRIVADVLNGLNIRNATEKLTKRRINLLNGALLSMYVNIHDTGVSLEEISTRARSRLMERGLRKEDESILRWMLGLTGKQVENVLRSNEKAWDEYVQNLRKGIVEAADVTEENFGASPLSLAGEPLSWEWILTIMMVSGAQTLSIRGAEKSMYGKYFEKLVLLSALTILGFRHTTPGSISERSFWLSSKGNSHRESDATAIWKLGQGVKFDIGFIGKGNPEITLDKVSRFERKMEMGGVDHYMHTFIIVDSVSSGSSIPDMAAQIGGTIIQMSANDRVQVLGDRMADILDGYISPLRGREHREYEKFIQAGVAKAPLESVIHAR